MASLSRVKQVAGETLFHTEPVGQPSASAPDAEVAITIAWAALEMLPVKLIAIGPDASTRQQDFPRTGLVARPENSLESATPKGTLSIRIDPEMHMQMKLMALQNRMSLGDLVTQACREKLATGI